MFGSKPRYDISDADREVQLYKEKRQFQADQEIFEKVRNNWTEVQDARKENMEERTSLSESFYIEKADKETTFAKLDAKIEAKRDTLNKLDDYENMQIKTANAEAVALSLKMVIEEKDKTIVKMDDIIKVVVSKLPDVDLGNLNFNITNKSSKKEE